MKCLGLNNSIHFNVPCANKYINTVKRKEGREGGEERVLLKESK